MKYTLLGNTDIKVSSVCVGCMSFGKAGTMHDWTLDENQTEKVVQDALSLGINFLIRQMVIRREPVKNIWDVQLKIILQGIKS
jgi:predicted aldo/keto reductase-like oxidoreductase